MFEPNRQNQQEPVAQPAFPARQNGPQRVDRQNTAQQKLAPRDPLDRTRFELETLRGQSPILSTPTVILEIFPSMRAHSEALQRSEYMAKLEPALAGAQALDLYLTKRAQALPEDLKAKLNTMTGETAKHLEKLGHLSEKESTALRAIEDPLKRFIAAGEIAKASFQADDVKYRKLFPFKGDEKEALRALSEVEAKLRHWETNPLPPLPKDLP